MRFYNRTHAFYAGVDLHARSMFTHARGTERFLGRCVSNAPRRV